MSLWKVTLTAADARVGSDCSGLGGGLSSARRLARRAARSSPSPGEPPRHPQLPRSPRRAADRSRRRGKGTGARSRGRAGSSASCAGRDPATAEPVGGRGQGDQLRPAAPLSTHTAAVVGLWGRVQSVPQPSLPRGRDRHLFCAPEPQTSRLCGTRLMGDKLFVERTPAAFGEDVAGRRVVLRRSYRWRWGACSVPG